MTTLLAVLTLAIPSGAGPLASFKRMFQADPVRAVIAPCEFDFACVESGGVTYAMRPVSIAREGYDILATPAEGQPRLLLIKAHLADADVLALVRQDSGQVFWFHVEPDVSPRQPVAPEVIDKINSPEFRHFMAARTGDQVRARAETLVKRLGPSDKRTLSTDREAVLVEIERIIEASAMSSEAHARVRTLLGTLHGRATPSVAEDQSLLTEIKSLGERVDRDMKACGFSQACPEGRAAGGGPSL